MTTPDTPYRVEFEIEVPGSPEQVWDAIATAKGISAWMLPTDLEEQVGGTVVFHMGETDSKGTVTGWDPPRRLAYEEPDWAALAGHEGAPTTPIATEFLVEARSGGSCVVRVVSSAFGSGADWEQEFFDGMALGWAPMFDVLRLYVAHFPGQRATSLSLDRKVSRPAADLLRDLRARLGVDEAAGSFAGLGLTGAVERVSPNDVLLRSSGALPGLFLLWAFDQPDGDTVAGIHGHLFSPDADGYLEREQPAWAALLAASDELAP
jgi:uncharacterized protein YndB with AHSA1/START domain